MNDEKLERVLESIKDFSAAQFEDFIDVLAVQSDDLHEEATHAFCEAFPDEASKFFGEHQEEFYAFPPDA